MPEPRLPTLRRSDFSLDDVQQALRDSFAQFFDNECPITVVRDAEPLGFDAALWTKLGALGISTMALPEAQGGDGAGIVDLALIAEAQGRHVAPVPLVEHVVALRALAALSASPALASRLRDEAPTTVALQPAIAGGRQVVPNAAVARGVVALLDGVLVSVETEPASRAHTLGGAPLGFVELEPRDAFELARGRDAVVAFERVRLEWKVLMAAALVGLADGALDITVRYANERFAFGVPIGTFQALSHPMADVKIAVEGTRRLVWRAAWYLDHEPESAGVHAAIAFLRACEAATLATAQGIHTQGGFGFTLESDLHLFFRRAKSWPLVIGDPQSELGAIADLTFGPRTTVGSN